MLVVWLYVIILLYSERAGIEELKEGIVDRRYYDESYIHTIGKEASKKLGNPLVMRTSYKDLSALFYLM